MWKYDRDDPNDPNNPFGDSYRPRFVYELHVSPGPIKSQPQQFNVKSSAVQEQSSKNSSKMVVPYVEVDKVLAEILLQTSPLKIANRFYIVSGSVNLSFKGEIKSQQSILKTTFEGNKLKFAMEFQADGNRAFNTIGTEWEINPTNLNDSTCTAIVNNNSYTSTSVSVVGGMPSIGASTDDNGAGSSGLTFSPAMPTSLNFHYSTAELETQSGSSIIKGQLHLEVNIDVTPSDTEGAASGFSQVWSEAKANVEKAFLRGAGFATGNTGLIIIMKPASPTFIFNGISESFVKALEIPASSDNMAGDALTPAAVPITDMMPVP